MLKLATSALVFIWIYLYAAVNLKLNYGSIYCTTEATAYRHEASCRLSVTAGLLVT